MSCSKDDDLDSPIAEKATLKEPGDIYIFGGPYSFNVNDREAFKNREAFKWETLSLIIIVTFLFKDQITFILFLIFSDHYRTTFLHTCFLILRSRY